MSLIRWVGFVERYVLEEDVCLQILNQQGKKCTQANRSGCTHAGEGSSGAPFRAGDLEMLTLCLLENPTDPDKGTNYKLSSSKSNQSYITSLCDL